MKKYLMQLLCIHFYKTKSFENSYNPFNFIRRDLKISKCCKCQKVKTEII